MKEKDRERKAEERKKKKGEKGSQERKVGRKVERGTDGKGSNILMLMVTVKISERFTTLTKSCACLCLKFHKLFIIHKNAFLLFIANDTILNRCTIFQSRINLHLPQG